MLRGGALFLPLEGLIDLDIERKRLTKENERLTSLITGAEKKLANENFVKNISALKKQHLQALR